MIHFQEFYCNPFSSLVILNYSVGIIMLYSADMSLIESSFKLEIIKVKN